MTTGQLNSLLSEPDLEAANKSLLSTESIGNDNSTNTSGLARLSNDKSALFKVTKIALLKDQVGELERKIHLLRLEHRNIVTPSGAERLDPTEMQHQLKDYLAKLRTLMNAYGYFNGYLSEKRVRVTDDICSKSDALKELEDRLVSTSVQFAKQRRRSSRKGLFGSFKNMFGN